MNGRNEKLPPIRWGEFHRWPFEYSGDVEAEMNRLQGEVLMRLRCDKCRRHYRMFFSRHAKTIRAALALPLSEARDRYFEIGWKMHNDVNLRNGQPQITLNEAMAIYQKTEGRHG